MDTAAEGKNSCKTNVLPKI